MATKKKSRAGRPAHPLPVRSYFRRTQEEDDAWHAEAMRRGLEFTEWMRVTLNKAIGAS